MALQESELEDKWQRCAWLNGSNYGRFPSRTSASSLPSSSSAPSLGETWDMDLDLSSKSSSEKSRKVSSTASRRVVPLQSTTSKDMVFRHVLLKNQDGLKTNSSKRPQYVVDTDLGFDANSIGQQVKKKEKEKRTKIQWPASHSVEMTNSAWNMNLKRLAQYRGEHGD